jgi:hypothetical protein
MVRRGGQGQRRLSAVRQIRIKGCGLAATDTGFGTSDAGVDRGQEEVKAEFVVSALRRQRTQTTRDKLKAAAQRHVGRRQRARTTSSAPSASSSIAR